MKNLILLIAVLIANHVLAGKQLRHENFVYEPGIKSVQLTTADGSPVPLINLNTAEKLVLHFDELKSTNDYYQFTYILCDANWKPADFEYNTYCKGMPYSNVDDFKFSQGTYIKYVHYQKVFPDDQIAIQWAGNYILKVYRNFDENDVVLTRRFMVLNRQLGVNGSIKPATDVKFRNSKQELDLEVDYTNFQMPNPMQDVKVIYQQNCRWDNCITGLRPQYIVNNKLNYNFEDVNLFNGGNEFRMFDTRSLRKFTQFVAEKKLDKFWHCTLVPDDNRGFKIYTYYPDFNGRRAFGNKDQGTDPNTDADYCEVIFSLPMTGKLDQDIYIFGEFTDWQLYPEYKLIWNENTYRYEWAGMLKQGVYNYFYTLANGSMAEETLLEGNHMETENDYQVWVYHKNVVWGYDELVGMLLLNTGRAGNR